jgi:molecular chaperone GrpE
LENENKIPIDETLEPEVVETTETSETAEEPEQEIEDEMAILRRKNDEMNDKYLRLMAEYDNFRKRSQREREEIYPTATVNAVMKFLPVLDNIERAAAFPHAEDDFGKGFDLIYQGFQDVLKNLGVEPVGEVGEPFDPAFHNAVMHIEDEALGENVISQVLQKGYRIGDKVIRYAMVQTAN